MFSPHFWDKTRRQAHTTCIWWSGAQKNKPPDFERIFFPPDIGRVWHQDKGKLSLFSSPFCLWWLQLYVLNSLLCYSKQTLTKEPQRVCWFNFTPYYAKSGFLSVLKIMSICQGYIFDRGSNTLVQINYSSAFPTSSIYIFFFVSLWGNVCGGG